VLDLVANGGTAAVPSGAASDRRAAAAVVPTAVQGGEASRGTPPLDAVPRSPRGAPRSLGARQGLARDDAARTGCQRVRSVRVPATSVAGGGAVAA
jgi:hypothetical protein